MATFLTDAFTDTDTTLLSAHTADSGGTWAKNSTLSGVLTCRTNRFYCSTTNACYYNTVGTPIDANYEVSATITVVTNINSNIGVCGRMATTANTMYYAYLERISTGGGTYNIQLKSYVTGTVGNLGTYNITAPSGDHTIRLRMVGDQISVDWDGVTRIGPVTDTAVTAAGKAGVRATTASSTTTGYHLADVTASDVPSGSLVAAVKKVAASMSGEVLAPSISGELIASAKRAAAVFGGVQQPSGSITAATMHPVVISAGGQAQAGAAAMAVRKAVATLAGSQPFAGTVAAELAKVLFGGAGEQQQAAPATTGAITAALKPVNAYCVAAQTVTGICTATLPAGNIAASGVSTPAAAMIGTLAAQTRILACVARAFYLPHTPPKRTYTVPADDRTLIIPAESRVTVVPRISSTLLVRRGAT